MERMNRKSFIKKAGFWSLGAMSGSVLLSGCGGSTNNDSGEPTNAEDADRLSPAEESTIENAPNAQAEVDCSEYNQDLTEADINMRQSLEYVPETPNEEQRCSNCRFWQPEKFEGECGGCQLLAKGAVNPNGWCRSWVTQQT